MSSTNARWLRRALLGLGVAAAFAAGCSSAPSYPPPPGYGSPSYQRYMENALAALKSGYTELQQAEANKGGHRERAMELVQQAIAEVQNGIAWANEHRE